MSLQFDFDEDDGEQSSATMELPGETRLRSNKVTRWVYCKTEGICNLMWQVLHLILIFSTLTGKEWPWTVKEDGLSNQQQQPGRPGLFINGQPRKPGSTFWWDGKPEFACQGCCLRKFSFNRQQLLQELLWRSLFTVWQLRRLQHPNKQLAERTIFLNDWGIRFWGFRAGFGENWTNCICKQIFQSLLLCTHTKDEIYSLENLSEKQRWVCHKDNPSPPPPGCPFFQTKNLPPFLVGKCIYNGWNKFYAWSHVQIFFLVLL